MRRNVTIVVAGGLLLLLGAYVVSGLVIKRSREAAFDATKLGDTYDDVVNRFGVPAVTDGEGKEFTRYASEPCKSPCEKRLWFENRLFFDMEAWSVSLDNNGKVIEKYHWASP
jgi:hypothetical protein